MALVTVGHPIPGLTAYERFDGFSLAFVGGISGRINLSTGQQTQLTGLGYVINPATPAYESPYVLDAELANPNSSASVALRAALVTRGELAINVTAYGAVGDWNGTTGTDNTAAFQAALAAARTRRAAVYVPAGDYRITDQLELPSRVLIYGDGPYRSTIRQTNPDKSGIVSRNYVSARNDSPSGACGIKGLRISAIGSTNTGAHGIILRDYYSSIEDVEVWDFAGDAFRISSTDDAGTTNPYTLVENHYTKLLAARNGGYGFHAPGSTVTMTDSFIDRLVVQGRGSATPSLGGLRLMASAGWQIRQVHTYGFFTGAGVQLNQMWHTVFDGAQIERGWATFGLYLTSYQRGSTLDNISVSCGADGGDAVRALKGGLYPGEGLTIGSLTVIQDQDVACTAITWDNTNAPVRIGVLAKQGDFASRIATTGGFGASAIVLAQNVSVSGKLRDSSGARTLAYEDIPLALAGRQAWSGSGEKVLTIALPKISGFTLITGTVMVGSVQNNNGVLRAAWTADVVISTKNNASDNWVVRILRQDAPVGFTVAPTLACTHDVSGDTGALVVTFTPSDTDGYGTAGITLAHR